LSGDQFATGLPRSHHHQAKAKNEKYGHAKSLSNSAGGKAGQNNTEGMGKNNNHTKKYSVPGSKAWRAPNLIAPV
jgi:hypothetical protein